MSPDEQLRQFSELIGLPVQGVVTQHPIPGLLGRMLGKERNKLTVNWVPAPDSGWPGDGAFAPHVLTATKTSKGWFIRVEAGGKFVISATDRLDRPTERNRRMLMTLLKGRDVETELQFVKRVVTPRKDGFEGFINRTTYRSSIGDIVLHVRGSEPRAQSTTQDVVVEFVSAGRYFRLNTGDDSWLAELPF